MKRIDAKEVVRGSGNVFDDFGHADADIYHAKAVLAAQIIGLLDDHKLSVRRAHELTGFAAADFSRLRNADLKRFSIERLIRIISALDENAEVSIQIKSHKRKRSRIARSALGRQ